MIRPAESGPSRSQKGDSLDVRLHAHRYNATPTLRLAGLLGVVPLKLKRKKGREPISKNCSRKLKGVGSLFQKRKKGREPISKSGCCGRTALAGGPPHRSVREELPHTALTLGRRSAAEAAGRGPPVHRPALPGSVSGASKVRPFPWSIPFPPRTPPPPSGRLCSPASSVLWDRPTPWKRACRSYGICLLRPSRALRRGSFQGLPVPVHRVSTHAQGLRLRGVQERLAIGVASSCCLPLVRTRSARRRVISELNGWPACAPVNASPAMLPPPAHDSGSGWFATPFPCGSFIRYSMPVYPGASRPLLTLRHQPSGDSCPHR